MLPGNLEWQRRLNANQLPLNTVVPVLIFEPVYDANKLGGRMAYFLRRQDGFEREGKVAADIFCGVLLLTFLVVYFGLLGGLAFIVVYGAIIAVDYLMPTEDDASGAAIR